MKRVFLGLGSNLNAEENLAAGIQRLASELTLINESPWYRSPALGFDGPEFINLVLEIQVDDALSPERLSQQLKQIEMDFGRAPDAMKYSSRHLDIDILLFGDVVGEFATDSSRFILPREDIWKYAFVLTPLLDIAPDLICPKHQQSLSEFKGNIQDQSLALVEK
ncbi:2-amino-4-hydroxy-6-hydroxymethyldihydropteridine diphosphokinase [Bacterioplanoides sp.]|uniref:2-amino-4-hydroxy-6- hydroxymethyldihydropteridine diphosphokinase n=1 Tax=Bacterioplanoides sp. TaxID=2066072 RepID=UPI003B00C0A9